MNALPYIIFVLLMVIIIQLAIILADRRKIIIGQNKVIKIRKWSNISYIFLILGYLIFIIFCAFREIDINGIGGIDAYTYKMRFQFASGDLIQSLKIQNNEYGYGILIWIIRYFTSNYTIVLIIIYSLIYFIHIYFIKWIYRGDLILIINSLLIMFMLSSFNIFRSILSIYLSFIILIMLSNKKYKSSIFFTIIACSIHISAIILFLVIVIKFIGEKFNYKRKKYIYTFIATSFILYFIYYFVESYLMSTKYSYYIGNGALAISTYIIYLYIIFLYLCKYKELNKLNKFNEIIFICLGVGVSCIVIQAKLEIIYRMLLFFNPGMYIIVGEIIKVYKLKKSSFILNIYIKLSLYAILILKCYIFFNEVAIADGLYPYSNILFK